jgi:hypothetical protein
VLNGEFGWMAAIKDGKITASPLEIAASGPRLVPLDQPLMGAARSVGTSFGDET